MIHRGTQHHFQRGSSGYYARNYEAPRSRHERALALRREICLELLDGVDGRILDLGCGPGALAVPLAAAGRRIVALDLAHGMVSEARKMIGPDSGNGFVVGDAANLPFATGAFDAVVTTGVLEYVPAVDRAAAEIARILKPGGTLVATASLPRKLERAFERHLAPLVMRVRYGKPAAEAPFHRAFSTGEFDTLLESVGLRIDARRFSCFAPFPLDAIYPPLVTAIDERLGSLLERVDAATARAKTYVVRATRP